MNGQTIDDACYNSGISGGFFDIPDAVALTSISLQGIHLLNKGLETYDLGVYFDGVRFMKAKLMADEPSFESDYDAKSFSLKDNAEAQPDDYKEFLNLLIEGRSEEQGLTIFIKNQEITDQVLSLEDMSAVEGEPDHEVPHIKAMYKGIPVMIFTCGVLPYIYEDIEAMN